MLAKAASVALVGTDAHIIDVEVYVGSGLPGFAIVGRPGRSVREAEQRARAALEASGEDRWPNNKVVANLAPGRFVKEGTHFDLALAIGVLTANEKLHAPALSDWVMVGELALNGAVRPVRGVLPAAMAARAAGKRGIICPAGNSGEAALVEGLEIVPVGSLNDCRGFLDGTWTPAPVEDLPHPAAEPYEDLSEVRGHPQVKRALEVSAAGAHNLLMDGPPGTGKTMLARRLPGILPDLSLDEALEVTQIHSVAGLLGECTGLVTRRPFRVPHHHVSMAGLIGGGSGLARPGEVSLAHNGVLFLDEIGLYSRHALDGMRGPLEDGMVTIARSGGAVRYLCRFALVASMNPCPCGYLGDPRKRCTCSDIQLSAYRTRLSGPLLDRFDMQIAVERVGRRQMLGEPDGEISASVRRRVERCRLVQSDRYGSTLLTNASAPRSAVHSHLHLTTDALHTLGAAIEGLALSGRGVDRSLRVARTIADLAGSEQVADDHIGEAISLRVAGRLEAGLCV